MDVKQFNEFTREHDVIIFVFFALFHLLMILRFYLIVKKSDEEYEKKIYSKRTIFGNNKSFAESRRADKVTLKWLIVQTTLLFILYLSK
jgi:hypothetical protein